MSQIRNLEAWKELSRNFRRSFNFISGANVNWFPGHMTKSLKVMERVMKQTDLVIEVHDGRIPLSGRYLKFGTHLTGTRPQILLLNKKDLAFPSNLKESERLQKRFRESILQEDPKLSSVIFTNAKDQGCTGLKSILPIVSDLIRKSERYHRASMPESNILVIGVPNVGKSSFINQIRTQSLRIGGKVAAVGPNPGITRAVQNKIRISDKPLIYVLDTPGIMMPNIRNMHTAMKLALCATMKDEAVGIDNLADYLLFWLNKNKRFEYVDYMDLIEPVDECRVLLAKSASAKKWFCLRRDYVTGINREFFDQKRAAEYFIKGFRTGKFGPINLDIDQLLDDEES